MAFSPNDKYLYVLNELSGHVTQYAIDSGKGTLTLVDSISSVPAEAGLAWGAPQAPVGAAPTLAAAPPKDEKPKVWAADIQITPNGKFLYSTEEARLRRQFCDRGAAARHPDRSKRSVPRRVG
jgi:6-phosphogluconolactonase